MAGDLLLKKFRPCCSTVIHDGRIFLMKPNASDKTHKIINVAGKRFILCRPISPRLSGLYDSNWDNVTCAQCLSLKNKLHLKTG